MMIRSPIHIMATLLAAGLIVMTAPGAAAAESAAADSLRAKRPSFPTTPT